MKPPTDLMKWTSSVKEWITYWEASPSWKSCRKLHNTTFY